MDSAWVDQVWLAADRMEVRQAVSELYAQVQREVDQRRPRCDMSGRCCKFEDFGHRMYITTIELAVFLCDLQKRFSPDQLHQNFTTWNGTGCPFQSGKLCGVHQFRPFGCRIFFCDPTSTRWQQEQYELFHAKLKVLHGTFGVPYAYVEWRNALQLLLTSAPGHRGLNHAGDVARTI
jgi:Fe-S-cluster containining protein